MSDQEVLKLILAKVTVIEEKVNVIEEKVNVMEGTLIEHSQLLAALEHRTEENTAQLNHVVADVQRVVGSNANIQKNLTQVQEELVKHGNLLDVLAVRSTHQEAELRSLKQVK